jgi:anti-sigma-K factor RskA
MKTEERHAQLELCIPYVFGRLNPGNRKQFDAHLTTGCEQCTRELSELYEAIALLPLLLKQEAPPSGLRQRILSRLSSKPSKRPEPQRAGRPAPERETVATPATKPPARSWYLSASIVMGILLIIALLFFLSDQLKTTGDLEKKLSDLQAQVQQQREIVEIFQARRVEMLPLVNADSKSEGFGKIFWDPEKRRAVLQVVNLQPEPADKQYQLWLMKDKKLLSAGAFDVTRDKANVFTVMTLPIGEKRDLEGFAVTLEPRGGSTQPSGAIVLQGGTK